MPQFKLGTDCLKRHVLPYDGGQAEHKPAMCPYSKKGHLCSKYFHNPSSGVLCLSLISPVQEIHSDAGQGPMQSH